MIIRLSYADSVRRIIGIKSSKSMPIYAIYADNTSTLYQTSKSGVRVVKPPCAIYINDEDVKARISLIKGEGLFTISGDVPNTRETTTGYSSSLKQEVELIGDSFVTGFVLCGEYVKSIDQNILVKITMRYNTTLVSEDIYILPTTQKIRGNFIIFRLKQNCKCDSMVVEVFNKNPFIVDSMNAIYTNVGVY